MIQLHPDCLLLKMSTGEAIPCSAEWITEELMGDAVSRVNQNLVENAAAAVLHYFKAEKNQESVSVDEFAQILAQVLRGFGLDVRFEPPSASQEAEKVAEMDLRQMASHSGKGYELTFFHHLRDELNRQLEEEPAMVRFRGLRGCVKQIVGARRWSPRCQELNDQIVEYLRWCWTQESKPPRGALIVS